ncbi:hypothetical protein SAMN04487852_106161 [Prevotella sp. tf2-5]|nr:hypothetical protein SAMN04487852_106161 [Prevotella sp. tf2-5]
MRRLKKNYRKQIKRQLSRDFFLLSKSDINSISLYVPNLKDDDTLFVPREDNGYGHFPDDDEILMQNGYASTSVLLLNLIKLSNDRFLKESYINPVMFCFRQYLELTMKDSLLRFRLWRKSPSRGEANLDGHNLFNLWRDLKQYIGPKDKEVNRIGKLVEELNAADEDGTLFRYNEFLTNSIKNTVITRPLIDINVIKLRILQMYSFFEGVNELARKGLEEIVGNR